MVEAHVKALTYLIEHANSVAYSASPPLKHETEDFRVRIEDDRVFFEMKRHHSSVESAKEVVNRYVEVWELETLLMDPLQEFSLRFNDAEVVARNPVPGQHVVFPRPVRFQFDVSQVSGTVVKPYPRPPSELTLDTRDEQVVYMATRLKQYHRHSTHLPDLANLCFTTVVEPFEEYRSRKLSKASAHYAISKRVLKKLTNLAANKGGPCEARKAQGAVEDKKYSDEERRFLESAVRIIIRRLAEKKRHPSMSFPVIGMDDLPPLNSSE